jgi:hypothetical protein
MKLLFEDVKNLPGDVTKVVDSTGEIVNSYSYDAWGNYKKSQIPENEIWDRTIIPAAQVVADAIGNQMGTWDIIIKYFSPKAIGQLYKDFGKKLEDALTKNSWDRGITAISIGVGIIDTVVGVFSGPIGWVAAAFTGYETFEAVEAGHSYDFKKLVLEVLITLSKGK